MNKEILALCLCHKAKKMPGKKVFAVFTPRPFTTFGSIFFHFFMIIVTLGFWIPLMFLYVIIDALTVKSSFKCRECGRRIPANNVVSQI